MENNKSLIKASTQTLSKVHNQITLTNKVLAGISREWWDNLTDEWKKIFLMHLEIDKEGINLCKMTYEEREEMYGHNFDTIEAYHQSILNSQITLDKALSSNDLTRIKNLTWLWLRSKYIEFSDIIPLINLVNLQKIYLDKNQIEDISVLENLVDLQMLHLTFNQIKDISALENLSNLQELWLHNNQIEDIRKLATLSSLQILVLRNNPIMEISHLKELHNLKELRIGNTRIGNNLMEDSILIKNREVLDSLKKHCEIYY